MLDNELRRAEALLDRVEKLWADVKVTGTAWVEKLAEIPAGLRETAESLADSVGALDEGAKKMRVAAEEMGEAARKFGSAAEEIGEASRRR